MKAPNSKHQHPENNQAPSFKRSGVRLLLDVEVWSFSGAWMLVLGAFASVLGAFYL
jgi:hypothetical protein